MLNVMLRLAELARPDAPNNQYVVICPLPYTHNPHNSYNQTPLRGTPLQSDRVTLELVSQLNIAIQIMNNINLHRTAHAKRAEKS